MTELVFVYGTLMSGFKTLRGLGVDGRLKPEGRGSIAAALFDLGRYPAAIPSAASRVLGEIHRMSDAAGVLAKLDEFERFDARRPAESLYLRTEVPVTFEDGRVANAWVYFYNAPLGPAPRIESGDYLAYLTTNNARMHECTNV